MPETRMSERERETAADWLQERADELERDEPYATTTIAALRTAADTLTCYDDAGRRDDAETT